MNQALKAALTDALSTDVDPETQSRHLALIEQAARQLQSMEDELDLAGRRILALEKAQAIAEDRIHDLEEQNKALAQAIREIRFQAVTWNEALTAKPPADPRYEDARRAMKVIGLVEIIRDWKPRSGGLPQDSEEWDNVCAELFRRYGHLRHTDGTPFWTKPPTVSEKTKTLIAEALKLR